MRVNKYHTHDDMSVLELETPLQSYKEELGQEAYAQATEFYKSDEWKKVERDHLNSDRRYYENRKACSLDEYSEWENAEARKQRFEKPSTVVLHAERKLTNGFDDLFDDRFLKRLWKSSQRNSTVCCIVHSRVILIHMKLRKEWVQL